MGNLSLDVVINQIGFKASARKSVYTKLVGDQEFRVQKMMDCLFEDVYVGKLENGLEKDGTIKYGDFTSFQEEGIYRIKIGEHNSRNFVIHNQMNDPIQRTLFNFVTLQSCGSNLGWNGKCHTDDSILLKSGELRDLSGGFHQSSDLRKWSWGISAGMIGLLEYALSGKPVWDSGEIEREIRNGCDFYFKLILDDGSIIDSANVPYNYDGERLERKDSEHLAIHGEGYGDYKISWNKREFYERPTAPPAHWFTIRFLALASRYFKEIDSAYSNKCLENAKRIWSFMKKHRNEISGYKLEIYPPLGHEPINKWWSPFYEDSAIELASMACAGVELKVAENSAQYDQDIIQSLNKLCDLQVKDTNSYADGAFWEGSSERLANNYHYFFTTNVPTAIYKGINTFKDHKEANIWKESLKLLSDQYLKIAETNNYRRIYGNMFTKDIFEAGANFSFSEELANDKPEIFKAGSVDGQEVFYKYYSFCYNLDLSAAGIVLKHSAKIFDDARYELAAQNQIDWILGANPFDASSVEGLGYNNPHRGVFGEFFPPVPQIPGGVYTGITEHAFLEEAFGLECEYDLPETTWFMHLLAL